MHSRVRHILFVLLYSYCDYYIAAVVSNSDGMCEYELQSSLVLWIIETTTPHNERKATNHLNKFTGLALFLQTSLTVTGLGLLCERVAESAWSGKYVLGCGSLLLYHVFQQTQDLGWWKLRRLHKGLQYIHMVQCWRWCIDCLF